MKPEREIIVGLDIGTTKICVIVGEKTGNNKINILGMGRTESKDAVLRGMVINIDRTVEAIKRVIEEASQKSNVDIKTIHVGIAGQHIKSMHHRGQLIRNFSEEEITAEDIGKLIENAHHLPLSPGEQILHIFPQDYIIDDERGIKIPVGSSGVKLEGNFHIITCQVTASNTIRRCVQKAGLELGDLILEPVASADAVLSEEEKEAGVVLVDIGGGTTDVAIFEDGLLRHTAVIPLAGEIITRDIKEGCNVIFRVAEALKVEFGSAWASEVKDNVIITIKGIKDRPPREIAQSNLAKIIQARVEEIFEHVNYEIITSGLKKKLQGGIVLTGGGAQLKHLTQLVEYITGMDARVGYPTEHLSKGMTKEVGSPDYATCIGLVLNGLDTNTNNTMKEVEKEVGKVEKAEKKVRIHILRDLFKKGPISQKFDDFLKDGQGDFSK